MHWTKPSRDTALGARYTSILRGALAVVAAGLVGSLAFAYLFTTFMPWDDDGYFLQAYRDFLSGRILYDQVFSMYGPLTFFTAALLARFDVANVTHDTFRWILLPFWVAVATLMGGLVWRWTHRLIPSIAGLLLVGLNLRGLAKSVGHPQIWAIFAVVVLLWLGLESGTHAIKERRAFWAGGVIGAIALFKVNLGILVFIGFALAVSLRTKGLARPILCVLLTLAAFASGIAVFLFSPTTSHKWFAVVYMASLGVTLRVAIAHSEERRLSLTTAMWLVTGLAVCVCIGVAATLATGTTAQALYSAYITMPALFARSYYGPFLEATRKGSMLMSTIGLVVIVGVFCWSPKFEIRPVWIACGKVIAGGVLLCAFCYDQRVALTGSLLFMWLLIANVEPLSGRAYSNRLLLAFLSLLFSLQLFPMAGEQVDWASLLPITAAAVLLADGMNYIARESRRGAVPRLTGFVPQAIAILLTTYLFAFVAGDAFQRFHRWRNSQPVNLPGTLWLRLPATETGRLNLTVSGLTTNCETVLMVPGLYSFTIWSGISPFEEKRSNNWPLLWPDDVQKNELRKLRYQRQGCVLVSQNAYRFFKHFGGSQRNNEQLLSEIQQTMRPIYTVQDVTLYKFYEPK